MRLGGWQALSAWCMPSSRRQRRCVSIYRHRVDQNRRAGQRGRFFGAAAGATAVFAVAVAHAHKMLVAHHCSARRAAGAHRGRVVVLCGQGAVVGAVTASPEHLLPQRAELLTAPAWR